MDWLSWFFIISISVFVLGMIIIGLMIYFKLRNRNKVRAEIFLKTGGKKTFFIDRKKGNLSVNTIDKQAYVFDERAIIKTSFKDFIYYLEDNPNPIIYDFRSNKPEIIATDLKTILDSDLVTKLFTLKELKTIQLLLIICLVIGILNILMLFYLLFSGVTLKDNQANRDLIYNITKSAIMGY